MAAILSWLQCVNSLAPFTNGLNFVNSSIKCIFLKAEFYFLFQFYWSLFPMFHWEVSIGWGNGLAPTRGQAMSKWIDDDSFHWCICTGLQWVEIQTVRIQLPGSWIILISDPDFAPYIDVGLWEILFGGQRLIFYLMKRKKKMMIRIW